MAPGTPTLRANQTENGTYEIAIQLDGYYSNADDAVGAADFWVEQLRAAGLPIHRAPDTYREGHQVRMARLAAAEDDDFVATVVEWLNRDYGHLMVSPSPEASHCRGMGEAPTKPGQDPPNVAHVTPADAYREASKTRERQDLAHAWWPGGPTPFSKKIKEASHSLAALGWYVTTGIRKNLSGKHGGGGARVYRIAWRDPDQD